MNRSIFIVIVDFLLLSLIAFVRFDNPQPVRKQDSTQSGLPPLTRDRDMVDVMKISLDQEKQERDKLNQQLNQTQEVLRSREQLLSERDREIKESQEILLKQEQEAQRLTAEHAALQNQFSTTRSTLSTLQSQLATSSNEMRTSRQRLTTLEADVRRRQEELASARSEARQSKERLSAMELDLRKRQEEVTAATADAQFSKEVLAALEADLRRRTEESARLQQNLQTLQQQRQAAESEKQKLVTQLQVAETEKRLTREQLDTMKTEVQVVRDEKTRLAAQTTKLTDEVTTLAKKSDELKTELQQNRPMAPNTLFSDLMTNRISSSIFASRSGLFSQVERDKAAQTVLVSDGTNLFAIQHIQDTPLSLGLPGTDWDRIMASLRRGVAIVSVSQISFWANDPRVILVPVDPPRAKALGVKTYQLAKDPYKFQEVVLVSSRDGSYGECKFELDPQTPQYVRIDRNVLKRLVGNYAPGAGDLVFSKTGQVVGVMVNKDYCAVVNHFASNYQIRTGVSVGSQQTGQLLAAMWMQVSGLPMKLQ